jgi:long-chain acyl-CoA synthetase
MVAINTILKRFESFKNNSAIYWMGSNYTYKDLLIKIDEWVDILEHNNINQGSICGFVGDYSPATCSLVFALMKRKAIIVPLSDQVEDTKIYSFKKIAGVKFLITIDNNDNYSIETNKINSNNNLISDFIKCQHPGLVVFTSGSTGEPKGILHDCENVMGKFIDIRNGWGTILFLLVDHFGGFNTLLSSFAYGGSAICIPDRKPESVCQIIEETKATLLPTTPTFINMLIASRSYQNFDLSSIKLITYGTEVMPESTLVKLKGIFPNAKIKQTYGLSELGVLRSKSKSDNSVWVKVGGEGFETKIIDGYLWVRSHSNMVGYLNAPNPINKKGWMNTGDQVEVKGDYIKILGRKSEMINIGGQKVFPIEIETVLLEAENITEATVFGKDHPIMGKVLSANISLKTPESLSELKDRLRKHCVNKLANWKVPLRFNIMSNEKQHNERFKKIRNQ